MLPLRYTTAWRVAGIVLLVMVLAATLMPAAWVFESKREFALWFFDVDKWLHATIFAFLAAWYSGQFERRSYWKIAAGLLLFGVLIEACQRLVTYRSAEWYDILADLAGILVGLLAARAGLGGWSVRVESWLARRPAAR